MAEISGVGPLDLQCTKAGTLDALGKNRAGCELHRCWMMFGPFCWLIITIITHLVVFCSLIVVA